MNALILYMHLAVIAVVSTILTSALKEHETVQLLPALTALGAMLTAFIYAVWSLVRMVL